MFVKIGGIEMNVQALDGISQDEFVKMFKGKMNSDIKEAYEKLKTYFTPKKEEPPKQSKK